MVIKPYTLYDPSEILPLYEGVGWTNYTRSPAILEQSYRHSLCALGAYEDDALIGIIRAVGDGYSSLLIQDLIVLPAYQRKGVGTRLVRALMDAYPHVYQVQLLTDNTEKTRAFYRSLGFAAVEEINCRAFLKMNT